MSSLSTVSDLDKIDLENSKLSDLFDQAWKSQQVLFKSSEESSSEYESRRKKTIAILNQAKSMIEEIGLFSSNEGIEEISTREIRYFLVDSLLGWLNSKISSSKPDIRLPALRLSREHYLSFLKQTRSYEIHSLDVNQFNIPDASNNTTASVELSKQAAFDANLVSQANQRNEKIRRYRELKEIEGKMENMNLVLASAHADEEQIREIHMTYVKYWINKAVDELKLLNDEIQILGRYESGEVIGSKIEPAAQAGPAKKPFIITKNELQAKVFGLGYPSVPVYSIDQFYDQLQERGDMPATSGHHDDAGKGPVQIGGGVTETQKEQEKAERDRLDDLHDEEQLRKDRDWDEFKDENKRGSGNRHNRS